MIGRRDFLSAAALFCGGLIVGKSTFSDISADLLCSFYMPDESDTHQQTWMAFVANDYIWSPHQSHEIKRNLALIANTIAKYEPVSVLVSPADYREAKLLLTQKKNEFPIELVIFEVNDFWLRDTGPTFVVDQKKELFAIDFNFNGWGNKQRHDKDANVARFITDYSKATPIVTQLVLEGGCIEVDGHGTAIVSKSCVLNDNRNPHLNREQIEQELLYLLGLKKIIWLNGVKGKDITDGHTDFYARFVKPRHIVVHRENDRKSYDYDVTRENIRILKKSTDAKGNKLHVTIIDAPDSINEQWSVSDFAAGYIGYYVCNGAVIAQKFGDKKADNNARLILERAFPDRVIEQLQVDGIASGGGSIHCTTQQQIMS
ncbi:agmatine deiminase family protein [Eionea flava]